MKPDKIAQSLIKYNGTINVDHVECMICGLRSLIFKNHLKKHCITNKEYKEKYIGSVTVSEKYLADFAKINPWKSHGGKLSIFSKNCDKYANLDEIERDKIVEANIKNVNDLAKENPSKLSTRIEYYLAKGLSYDAAVIALHNRQSTGSLEKYIKKYGEDLGKIKHKERQMCWIATMNSKTPEEISEINRKKMWNKGSYSLSEVELYATLSNKFINKDYESQYVLSDESGKNYIYDMRFGKTLIEYNGDFWHANPILYNSSWINPVTKKTANEIWDKDDLKARVAVEAGFKIIRIWEHDWVCSKDDVLQYCLRIIND